MYKYLLPYGKSSIEIFLPGKAEIYKPKEIYPNSSLDKLFFESLENSYGYSSLFEFLKNKNNIAISIEDYTRPIDNRKILSLLFKYLREKNLNNKNIKIIVATGLHKDDSLYDFKDIAYDFNIEVLKHNPDKDLIFIRDNNLGNVGLNKYFYTSDAKIIIGDVIPHQIFGFSGPLKSIIPGLSDRNTINRTHKAFLDYELKSGQENNIVRNWVEEFSKKIPNIFSITLVQNINNEVITIKTGDIIKSFNEALKVCKEIYCFNISKLYDVVITSPGYPFDQDLYQIQKAFRHASYMTKKNGKIIVFAPCERGWGSESFKEAVEKNISIEELRMNFSVGTHKLLFFLEISKSYDLYLYSNYNFKNTNIKKFIKIMDDMNISKIIKDEDIAILIGGNILVPVLEKISNSEEVGNNL